MAEVKHEGWKADCGFHRHDPKMTCSVRITSGVIHPKTESEARLIAAAPDLFEAAKSLLDAWDARTTGAQQILTGKSDRDLQKQAADALEALRAALSKATAQQEGR